MKRFPVPGRRYRMIKSDFVFKSISISIISNPLIILQLCNVCIPLNGLLIWIPSSVSDGMSNSNTIINCHSPISHYLYSRNYHIPVTEKEKEDLINYSYHYYYAFHYQWIPLTRLFYTLNSKWIKNNGFESRHISFIIHSIIHTLKCYWLTLIECFFLQLNRYKRWKILQFKSLTQPKWILIELNFSQTITIHYRTFTHVVCIVYGMKAEHSKYHTFQFIQSINNKYSCCLKTMCSNLKSFQRYQGTIQYTGRNRWIEKLVCNQNGVNRSI